MYQPPGQPIEILMVEDNPGDARLAEEITGRPER